MPEINIDELVEPINVTVGGKQYIVEDISRELAKKMEAAGNKAEKEGSDNIEPLVVIMTEVLGAEKADIAALGMRKLLTLVSKVMGIINDEVGGKNVPEAVVTK